jgi:predicted MFS family arabinose efflux permease
MWNPFAEWPAWVLRTFMVLLPIAGALALGSKSETEGEKTSAQSAEFRAFRNQYLLVYCVVMLADWLQGTNMYTLYSSYGVSVSSLFMTGFLCSSIFGTTVGLYVDTMGRRMSCIIYCVLEIIINLLEHVNNMPLLLFGRFLGGISTNLLFSAFESWMVTAHRRKGFPEEWLKNTFGLASALNGTMAIAAGFLAQVSADIQGEIGPFQLAILLTVVALVLVSVMWTENYGEEKKDETTSSTWRVVSDKRILLVAASTSLFEGSMYTFVFMWVPTLLGLTKDPLPTGLVFSCFMCCITIGGLLFERAKNVAVEKLAIAVFALAALSVAIPVASRDFMVVFIAFLGVELAVGMFFPCGGTLRSRYIPDELQGSAMNLCRLPLNILVVVGTKLTDLVAMPTVFAVCASWFTLGLLCQCLLAYVGPVPSDKKEK